MDPPRHHLPCDRGQFPLRRNSRLINNLHSDRAELVGRDRTLPTVAFAAGGDDIVVAQIVVPTGTGFSAVMDAEGRGPNREMVDGKHALFLCCRGS